MGKEGQPRHRSADGYPQQPKTEHERKLEKLEGTLDPRVLNYVSLVDGLANRQFTEDERVNRTRDIVKQVDDIRRLPEEEKMKLYGQLGLYTEMRNDVRRRTRAARREGLI